MSERDAEDAADSPKPFVEHLDDLRSCLFGCVVTLIVSWCLAIPAVPWLIRAVKYPLGKAGEDPDKFLRVFEVTGGLSIAMQTVMWTGILIGAPGLLFFIARFVFPGLRRKERRVVLGALGFATLLFAAGVSLGYFMILPVTLQWMFGITRWVGGQADFVQLNDYITFVLKLLLGFGLAFEFPVVVVSLGSLGLVKSSFLGSKRRHVIVILLIVSAIVTPTVDPVTQTLLAAPLYVLYEMCIWIVWFMERRKAREA